ncbi:MAG: TlpA disulfide reductase family protein [Deferrisomatales bacterium]|nr:TlpA disulfide reductase family protein [Deferrisomatales bacterium]
MNHRFLTLAWVVLLGAVLVTPATAFKRTAVGEDLKAFHLDTVAGNSLSLSASRGEKATLVVFWATWNLRSTQLLGDLQQLYAEHGGSGLQILAINAEHAEWQAETLQRVAETVAAEGLTYPVLIDRDLTVYNEYGVVAMPSALLADGGGKILVLQEGYPTAARLELRDQVLIALGVLEAPPVEEVATNRERLTDPKVRRKVEMGRLLLQRRRPSRAVKVLEEAIADDPTYAESYRVLAEVLDALERGTEAEAARARLAELEQPLETAVAAPGGGETAPGPAPREPLATPPTPPKTAR